MQMKMELLENQKEEVRMRMRNLIMVRTDVRKLKESGNNSIYR